MIAKTSFLHDECPYYVTDTNIGFRVVSPKKGDNYINSRDTYNTLIFLLEGEIELSYNEYMGKKFTKGDIIFIPQASYMYGVALTDAEMLVHTFDLASEGYCSNCMISKERTEIEEFNSANYDFKPLKMTPEIIQFAMLLRSYIKNDYHCLYLHELKQKELFIIMAYAYTHQEKTELFYPILGNDITFRNKVLRMVHELLTVKEYAHRLNMGERTFARKFKEEFGQTAQEWLMQHKIAQIKLRLSLPNVDVAAIIHDFKFPDARHFYRFCRIHFGCTSKELIRQLHSKTTT